MKLSVRNVSTFGFQMHKGPLTLKSRVRELHSQGLAQGGERRRRRGGEDEMERIRESE